MLNKLIFGVILLVIFGFASCDAVNEETLIAGEDKVRVVTTIFPLYEFVREVGGQNVEVNLLLPPGVEVHSFEPKPSDIIAVSSADLFVMIGFSMEPWAEDLINGVSDDQREIFISSEYVDLISDDDHGGYDPHIWLDFSNDIKIVEGIRDALSEIDSDHQNEYSLNTKQYIDKLQVLDNSFMNELSVCPKDTFITGGHGAYAYLSNRYGVQYLSAYGLAPDSEPTPQQLKSLIDISRETGTRYILFEDFVSPRIAEAISEETGTGVMVLNPVANIGKEDFDSGKTFIDYMQENLDTLKTVLECQK